MSHHEPTIWERMDGLTKAMLAVNHTLLAVGIAHYWQTNLGFGLGALLAYLLVFYE